jgi:hypothetical protein
MGGLEVNLTFIEWMLWKLAILAAVAFFYGLLLALNRR